ncbi:V-type ATP synthase subunit D [Streptomyces griseofuscus]|uniref:V-type ATP synthase subunit D n=1 Tax=Streptomyces griseofuscus TaxID=146922 RepID=UPI0038280E28
MDGPGARRRGAVPAQHRAGARRDGVPCRSPRRRVTRRTRYGRRPAGRESARTRQRVRALRRHCIPRLRDELAALELALEESEHAEAVRRRWAATRGGG